VKRLDSADKSRGKAQFTIDIQRAEHADGGGRPAATLRRQGRKLRCGRALKVKGVVDVKQIGSGVAVYATGMWPALKGREALKVSWDEAPPRSAAAAS
jgi:isoquinoline 1-oxidoreductase beta subunit